MALVELTPYLPSAVVDLRYATINNITGRAIYDNATPLIEESAAERLAAANDLLHKYRPDVEFKIWDAFRPMHAHLELLKINNDPRFVLEPDKSNHPKGLAVDLTLVHGDGSELDMGTDFDDFGSKAYHGAEGLTALQTANRQLLLKTMDLSGFSHWPYEWWHYDLKEEFRNGRSQSKSVLPR